jgi:hypothetical protein
VLGCLALERVDGCSSLFGCLEQALKSNSDESRENMSFLNCVDVDRRTLLAYARIFDACLAEVPEAAERAESLSRRIKPILQVCCANHMKNL